MSMSLRHFTTGFFVANRKSKTFCLFPRIISNNMPTRISVQALCTERAQPETLHKQPTLLSQQPLGVEEDSTIKPRYCRVFGGRNDEKLQHFRCAVIPSCLCRKPPTPMRLDRINPKQVTEDRPPKHSLVPMQ